MRRTLLTAATIGLLWFPLAAFAEDLDQSVCDSFPSGVWDIDSSTCSVDAVELASATLTVRSGVTLTVSGTNDNAAMSQLIVDDGGTVVITAGGYFVVVGGPFENDGNVTGNILVLQGLAGTNRGAIDLADLLVSGSSTFENHGSVALTEGLFIFDSSWSNHCGSSFAGEVTSANAVMDDEVCTSLPVTGVADNHLGLAILGFGLVVVGIAILTVVGRATVHARPR
jgi:hypothetical protein